MDKKQALQKTATLLLAFGLVPGAAATVQTNDAITRQFDAFVFAEVEFKDPGLGIHSSTSPCPIIIFGIRALVADIIYYQSDRVATNYKLGSIELPTGQPDTIVFAGPCPIPGSGPGAPVLLTIPDTNVYGPYDAVSVDQILCPQGNGPLPVTCLPDAATGLAVISHCNKDDAVFAPSPADGKSALANLAGSRAITCLDDPGDANDGFKYSTTYYDGAPTGYVDDWFFEPGLWGTDFSLIQNEDTTPLGNGIDETGYQVACTSTDVFVIDPNKNPSQFTMTLQSHDYKLILDLDGTPENWAIALGQHHANNLQGWHDLGGKNGFPCPGGDDPPQKKGDFPIVPTPLSPKKGGGGGGSGACFSDNSVPAGHDLFWTDPAKSDFDADGAGPLPAIHFKGVPIVAHDFGGSIGIQPVGDADTIVERGGPATTGSPTVAIELLNLQLQAVEQPELFITLQSDRGRNPLDPPDGPASTGSLTLGFNGLGTGGTLSSSLTVNFDYRAGSPHGPIVNGLLGLPTSVDFDSLSHWGCDPIVPRELEHLGALAKHGVVPSIFGTPALTGNFYAGDPLP